MDESVSKSMDESIAKLSESINQQASMALINLPLPNFDGSPDQDVSAFLTRFKDATLTLSPELRCLALFKALTGPARVWAKTAIKTQLEDGDWASAKKLVRERFTTAEHEIRLMNKLSQLKYDATKMTLSSFTEVYANLFKKVHVTATDEDIIRNLRLNLPQDIIKYLNVISADWMQLKTLAEFIKLATRIERNILPYETSAKVENSANMEALTAAIKELRETVAAKKDNGCEANQTTEVIAAISNQNNDRNYQVRDKRQYQETGRDNYEGAKRRFNQPQRNFGRTDQFRNSNNDLQRRYEETHGKVPYPCRTCNLNHFHKHCPYRTLN